MAHKLRLSQDEPNEKLGYVNIDDDDGDIMYNIFLNNNYL